MKHLERVKVPKIVVGSKTCDICGVGIKRHEKYIGGVELDIRLKTASNITNPDIYPREIISVDLCDTCFEDKLLPFLREQGCRLDSEIWP